MKRIDVVVIGGSLAGSACVRELSRLGVDAAAFERDAFPRAKVCGGFLSPGAVECLDRLETLADVRAVGAVSVNSARIRAMDREIEMDFDEAAMGVSRYTLDDLLARKAAVIQKCAVRGVERQDDGGFVVSTEQGAVTCKVVVDAAGKSSRWTERRVEEEFGVQFIENASRGAVLDFWFFEDGYGGAVSIEGGQSNFSFLIRKPAISRYVGKPGRLVTGPLAYDATPSEYIAIGDAAGMVDPFCGEGVHHALDSGMVAAKTIEVGLRAGIPYAEIKANYEAESGRRWMKKRWMASALRKVLRRPSALRVGLQLDPRWFVHGLWARMPT